MLAADGLNRLVEGLQKPGPVPRRQRRRAARDFAGDAKFGQQITGCDSLADVIVPEHFSARTDYAGTCFQATARQWNIAGDDDVVRLHMLDNPIICRVESVADNLEGDSRTVRNPHPGIGHQGDRETITTGDAIHLRLHRTRIRINKDVQQKNPRMTG